MTDRFSPDAVLFDLDGTLIDSLPTLLGLTNALLVEIGRTPLPAELLRGFVGDGPRRLVERALLETGGVGSDADLDAQEARFMARYEADPVAGTHVFDGVREGLAALEAAGLKLAVCTNKPETVSGLILAGLGLDRHLPVVVGGDSCARKKPAPDPALEACRRLGVEPARAGFVGDNEHDVACARAAGCGAVYLVDYGYPRVPLADLAAEGIFSRLDALAKALALPS